MKKIYYILFALLSLTLLLLASCRRMHISNNYSAPMATAMPAVVVRENEISSMDISDTKEQLETEPLQAAENVQAFEKLRENILALAPEGDGLEQETEKKLISYSDDTIIIAKVLPCNRQGKGGSFDWDSLPGNARIPLIAVGMFKLEDGALLEKDIATVPVLITLDEKTGTIDKIFVPEIYDEQKRAEDITKIFGVENEKDFGLQYEESVYLNFEKELHRLKYEIALEGGFDGFEYKTVDMLGQLTERGFTDPTEMEGSIRGYFLANTFECSSITVPIWHEFGREETDGKIRLYTVMYFGGIMHAQDGEPEISIYSAPVVIDITLTDDIWQVKETIIIDSDGQTLINEIDENFSEYADECLAFSGTQKSKDLIQELESIQNSLIEGTFNPED